MTKEQIINQYTPLDHPANKGKEFSVIRYEHLYKAMDEWAATQNKVLIDALRDARITINDLNKRTGVNYKQLQKIDAALASYVEQAPQERRKGPWKWKDHFYQIANAGDYDGFYEITNGTVSILTKDCVEAEVMEEIVDVLNASELNFYQDDSSHFVAQHFETENKELRKEIEKLEGQVTGKSAGVWVKYGEHIPKDKTREYRVEVNAKFYKARLFTDGLGITRLKTLDGKSIPEIIRHGVWLDESGEAGKQPEQAELLCMVCGKAFMGELPQMCCSGQDCGCLGMPAEPIVCSKECYDNLPHNISKRQAQKESKLPEQQPAPKPSEKMMPIHPADIKETGELKAVPFSFLNEEQAYTNHGQTLSRLAQRGGLGVIEMLNIINRERWGSNSKMPIQKAVALLKKKLAEFNAQTEVSEEQKGE